MGFFPLSCTCTCADVEGKTPSTPGGDSTRGAADDGGETPSTPGGDSTHRAAANNAHVPL